MIGVRADGKENVYFQPPSKDKMNYPCIVYELSDISKKTANNRLYNHQCRYLVTVIDEDPDSNIPGLILHLPMCVFDRHFTADNLNHDIFDLYF